MKLLRHRTAPLLALLLGMHGVHAQQLRYVQQNTPDGVLEGVVSPDDKVRTFKGIPYAAPPVGPLRWKEPQPVVPWSGVRKAVDYPPRAMQGRIYDDMVFNDAGPSEDCLYLNIWMPEHHAAATLPVMVWIHGGGFAAGSSSEPRQDAGNLSKKGVMIVSLNYRLGIFGFFTHPDLTGESGHHASGNYGLLDMIAALRWIKTNIAAFGGDPDNVTIFGESAGSFSVSALMASPLAQGLFHRAIGESGAFFSATFSLKPLPEAERAAEAFVKSAFGTVSLEALRAMPARKLLDAALKKPSDFFRPVIDGYLLPADCRSIYRAGNQSHIPLLAGWNKDEADYAGMHDGDAPTERNYRAHAEARFGANAPDFLRLYPAASDADAKRAARDFAGDMFTGYCTWKWIELHRTSGGSPVFRYEYDQTLPLPAEAKAGTEARAPHACEIEYVFQVLSSKNLPWRAEDYAVSDLISSYWTNFAKTGDPNGPGLPQWPGYRAEDGFAVMHIEARSGSAPDAHRNRYEFLDRLQDAP